MIEWLDFMATVGVAFMGYIAIEMRGLRHDMGKYGERLARVEGVLESASDGSAIR